MITDIHRHISVPGPAEEAVLSVCPSDLVSVPAMFTGQYYSVGFHPWDIPEKGLSDEDYALMAQMLARPDVVAAGECGIDLLRGPVTAIQMIAFTRQAQLASQVGKPVIVHCVKAYQQVIGICKELHMEGRMAIHGFRGKPSVAKMLTDAGFYLSFGILSNPSTLASVPAEKILAETDESDSPVECVIERIAEARSMSLRDTLSLIASNTRTFLNL